MDDEIMKRIDEMIARGTAEADQRAAAGRDMQHEQNRRMIWAAAASAAAGTLAENAAASAIAADVADRVLHEFDKRYPAA